MSSELNASYGVPRSEARGLPTSVVSQEAGLADVLITSRQNISPKRLVEPGPSAEQIDQLFRAAAAAPDHGLLMPIIILEISIIILGRWMMLFMNIKLQLE